MSCGIMFYELLAGMSFLSRLSSSREGREFTLQDDLLQVVNAFIKWWAGRKACPLIHPQYALSLGLSCLLAHCCSLLWNSFNEVGDVEQI